MKKHMATGLDSFSALFSIPDDRVGDMYAAYPMEADLEHGEDPRGMFFLGDVADSQPWLTQASALDLAESGPMTKKEMKFMKKVG